MAEMLGAKEESTTRGDDQTRGTAARTCASAGRGGVKKPRGGWKGYLLHGVDGGGEQEERGAQRDERLSSCPRDHVVAVAQEEVLHHEALQVLVDGLHLDVEHVLQEEQLVDHVVHQLARARVVATPQPRTPRPLRLDHLVQRHHQRDDVVHQLLEVLQRGGLPHERHDVLVVHYLTRRRQHKPFRQFSVIVRTAMRTMGSGLS